ncbi:MAG: alpha/beta hydrolase [Gemmatimonadetes bacterium]|nr:alpha/beta hydrolase [Gemmatimonadota bacterium]
MSGPAEAPRPGGGMLTRRATSGGGRPPLLLVHGAWSGAWVWEEHFLDYFAARGFDVYAPNLRAHGGTRSGRALRWTTIAAYVEDVRRAAATLSEPPVIVGHSMGGLIVQHYVRRTEVAGTALLCSVPPGGIRRCTLRVARHHPLAMLRVNLELSLLPLIEDIETAHHLLSSPSMPLERFRRHHARLQDESYRAFIDMLALGLPGRPTTRAPVLVMGAGDDFLFDEHDVRATASAYDVRPEMVAGVGHAVMLEPGWESFAERLGSWLDAHWPAHG